MSPPPADSRRGYSISSKPLGSKSISTYFQPVKKHEETLQKPRIQIADRLKSSNLKLSSSPFSPSRYTKPTGPFDLHKSRSTDSLTDDLATLKVNSQGRTPPPLRDLTTPKTTPINVASSDSEAEEEVITRRVLRKKLVRKAPVIYDLSDSEEEEHDKEDDEEDEEQPSTPKKRRRANIILESSDDDDVEDEAYVDLEEKRDKEVEDKNEMVNIERIQNIHPNRSVDEIREAILKTGGVVAATRYFADLETFPSRKKLRLNADTQQSVTREKLSALQQQALILRFFNTASSKDLQDNTGCKPHIADLIIEKLRPFANMEDLETKLRETKGASAKYISACEEMMKGYTAVDEIIKEIENVGKKLKNTLDIWQGLSDNAPTPVVSDNDEDAPDEKAGIHMMHLDVNPAMDKSSPVYKDALEGYLYEQPEYVNKEMTLKDYQLLGVNWMLLLYRKGISGILADEMGLGKTAQVISFLGRLYEIGENGPHLIIVPSSTMENWLREIKRFCPKLTVGLYHGSVAERIEKRYELLEDREDYQVIVTTYNIATSNADDRAFLKKLKCRSMILDEGHMVKNCTSARYKNLMKIRAPFRLLLTGTPLQNNLQELVSLLMFIMPETFADYEEDVRSIFKIRVNSTSSNDKDDPEKRGNETAVQVLSRERIKRAKKMMTPFVLRRKKEDVLKDLPKKIQIVESCPMTPNQKQLYSDIIVKSKKSLEEKENTANEKKSAMDAQFESMSNIIIHLRKAADHPLLFRKIYDDELCRKMTKEIMRDVKYWDCNEEYVYEDMCIMSDFELNNLCKENRTISQYQLKNNEWMDSGKIDKLKTVLSECHAKKEKVLIFSQFTRMLDILEMVMATLDVSYVRLDGETKVLERQGVIDDFNDSEDIGVFLLSTKAGGFGINLTSANVVVLYDLDFNPQNDRQAEDRAHRVGQTKDVRIVKLISQDSVEEYILKMADVKLRLDNRISSNEGDAAEFEEEDSEHQKKSLQNMIREAFKQADKVVQ